MIAFALPEEMNHIKLDQVSQTSDEIRLKMASGELAESCSMSAMPTPVKEAWSLAEALVEQGVLSKIDRQSLFCALSDEIQSELESSGYDDFDLIHETFLQSLGL